MDGQEKQENIVDYRALGERIQKRRQQLGYTQSYAAEKLDLSISFFSRVERGEKVASLETIIKIANGFGLSLDFLFRDSLEHDLSEALQTDISQVFIGKTPEQTQKLVTWLTMLSDNIDTLI